MSLSKSLLRAAKLQEKIDELRGQLARLLDQARAEVASTPLDEFEGPGRRGHPKMLKSARAGRRESLARPLGKAPTGRTNTQGRTAPVQAGRAKRRSPLAGQKRAASPSGPLAPAVAEVIKSKKNQPMNVRDILAGLLANGYVFNSPEPKKNLAARIYRLKGIKQVSSGLFGLA